MGILEVGKNEDYSFSIVQVLLSGEIDYSKCGIIFLHMVEAFKKELKGIYSSCISRETLDESPFAYWGLEIQGGGHL